MAINLRYETGITTFTQLVVIVPLAFINGLITIATSCFGDGSSCLVNTIFSMFFVLVLAGWYGFVSMLGYATQQKRSRTLAKVLIVFEGITALVALFVIQNPAHFFDVIIGFIALGLAVWTSFLAFRLHQSKGGRIVASSSKRRRTS